eukprot:9435260-Pyramimonas_sp.AAC.1
MLHYIHCPVLWRLVYHPGPPPVCPSARLGFDGHPSPEIVERIVRACRIYNIVRAAPALGPLDSEEALGSHHYNIRRAAQTLVEHSRAPF